MNIQDVEKPWKPVQQALEEIRDANRNRRGQDFLILGAGIAGLAAARELISLGHRVQILEGSSRVGGRIMTYRFKNGTTAELGAMRIPIAHDYTYHYIDQAGLTGELSEFRNNNPEAYFDIRGTVARIKNYATDILPKYWGGLNEAERGHARQGAGKLLGHYMAPLFDFLREAKLEAALVAGDFSDSRLRALDTVSWRRHLEGLINNGRATRSGIELVSEVLTIAAIWDWSLAAILRDELHQPGERLRAIRGGMDRLPNELAENLPENTIRFKARVTDIEILGRHGGQVTLAGGEKIPFQRMLCTLPFPVMRQIPSGRFSEEKHDAIQKLRYAKAIKVFFSYKRRWWEDEPYGIQGGASFSDGPSGEVHYPRQTYYPSEGTSPAVAAKERGPARFSIYGGETSEPETAVRSELEPDRPGALLASYTFNQGAATLCRESNDVACKMVADQIRKIHPDMPDYDQGLAWCWEKKHTWSRAALALTQPHDLSTYIAAAKQNEGRVYFAGEHVSIAPGWIQGSLESSLRELARMLRETLA